MNVFEETIIKNLTIEEMADLLNEAADIIAFEGWTQHIAVDLEGRHCLVGALRASANRNNVVPARFALQVAVAQHLGMRPTMLGAYIDILPLTEWNDTRGRTVDQVVDALRDTAKKILNGDINPKEQ